MQGHIGSLVRREAAEKLTPMVQPVSDGSSSWRGRRETHQIDSESLIKFRIKEICVLKFCVYYWRKYQYLLEGIISHKNLIFVSLRISLSKKSSHVYRFYSCISFGLFCLELFRTHRGIKFTRLHLSFVFKLMN